MAFSCFTCISYIDSRFEDRGTVPCFYPSSPVLRSRRAWEVVELAEGLSAAELQKGERAVVLYAHVLSPCQVL